MRANFSPNCSDFHMSHRKAKWPHLIRKRISLYLLSPSEIGHFSELPRHSQNISFRFVLFCFVLFCWARVSLCSTDLPGTHCVAKTGLIFTSGSCRTNSTLSSPLSIPGFSSWWWAKMKTGYPNPHSLSISLLCAAILVDSWGGERPNTAVMGSVYVYVWCKFYLLCLFL